MRKHVNPLALVFYAGRSINQFGDLKMNSKITAALLVFFGMIGIVAIGAVWRGYILTVLWGWFVVPTFGLPALGVAAVIGISLIVAFMTMSTKTDNEEGDAYEKLGKLLGRMILVPLIALGMGWAVQLFM